MNEVQIVPVDVVRRWQASLLNRLPGPNDAVPRLYACATCFGRETTAADYLEALGLPEAVTRPRRLGARLAGLYDRRG